MTVDRPPPHYESQDSMLQRSSPQQDDNSQGHSSPSRPTEVGEQLVDLFRPAVYGKSWTPTMRIAMVIAVVAVIVVAVLAMALLLVLAMK